MCTCNCLLKNFKAQYVYEKYPFCMYECFIRIFKIEILAEWFILNNMQVCYQLIKGVYKLKLTSNILSVTVDANNKITI